MNPAVADPRSGEEASTGIAPRRSRLRLVTGPTMAVLAVVTCAIGFYAGVRIEKSHAATSSSTTAARGFAAALGGTGSAAGASGSGRFASGAGTRASGASGTAGGGRASGFPGGGGFPGASAGGGATLGTVASVDGRTIVLTESDGDTVKVKLTSATTVTKSEHVGRGSVRPGDTITVTGASRRGTVSAASISDLGDTSTSTGSSGGSSSSSSSGGGISSLFGG